MNYCNNQKCPFLDCDHHIEHAPRGVAVTTLDMDKDCKRRWNYLATEAAKDAKMKRMTMGDAYIIFKSIDAPDIEDELKGLAIQKLISLETHNGVTKDMMVNVIRYLMGLCFEPSEVEP